MFEVASSDKEDERSPKEQDDEDEVETGSKMEVVVVSLVTSRPHSSGGLFQLHVE